MRDIRVALNDRRPLFGLCIMYPAPGVIERIGADWDWIWIDAQHGQMGYEQTLALVRACDLVDRPALVRVAWNESAAIALALDMNAAGVIVPCVDTPEEACRAVEAAKFPPVGRRSFGGRRPIDSHGRTYSDFANQRTLLVVQIESPLAVKNAEAIAQVEGVDALFLGPDDMILNKGTSINTQRDREAMSQDMRVVARACRQEGKLLFNIGIGDEMLGLALENGSDLIVAGGDVPFLANSSKVAAAHVRTTAETTGRTIVETDVIIAGTPRSR